MVSQVEPDTIRPLSAGKNCQLQVSASRARDEPEGGRRMSTPIGMVLPCIALYCLWNPII